jgi:hypothetical protein
MTTFVLMLWEWKLEARFFDFRDRTRLRPEG